VSADDARPGPGFWIGFAVGVTVMAYGIRGLVEQVGTETAGSVARWIVGADLAHDLVLAPIAIGVGWTAGRVVPGWARAPVQAGLVATGVLLLIAWAPLRGYGRAAVPDNPSVQPLDYGTALATVLALVWLVATVWARLRRRVRTRAAAIPAAPDRAHP
jgi:hypothetical protein